jgi:tRNA(adenine34) deaminase
LGGGFPGGGGGVGAMNLLQFDGLNHKCEVRGGVKSEECRELLREFFQAKRGENEKSGH